MQNQTSRKGRRRKVIREGKADVSFTGKEVTSHGGMALVARGMEAFGVRQALKSFADEFGPGFPHGTDQLAGDNVVVPCVIEALWTVAVTPLDKYQQSGDRLALARHRELTPTQRTKIADAALEHVGRSYSVPKLLAFGIDRLLGCNLSASMGPDELVCSSLLARAYAKVGIKFEGKANPRGVTPDDVWDEIKKSKKNKPWWVYWERE